MTLPMTPEMMSRATETASAATVTRPLLVARVRLRWAMNPGMPKRRAERPRRRTVPPSAVLFPARASARRARRVRRMSRVWRMASTAETREARRAGIHALTSTVASATPAEMPSTAGLTVTLTWMP